MATVYSLICWGGSAGKSVTVSSSTDYVTLTNHGLRDATGVAFTSGTLPTVAGTALALNTTYYAKSISSSTFELYYDSGLTSKIDFTSTGSSLIMKSEYYLGLSDKSRWTTGGVERIYDGIPSFQSTRGPATSGFDSEVCEIGMSFEDYYSLNFNFVMAAAPRVIYTSMVAGVRSGAFHNGTLGSGYLFNPNQTGVSGNNITIDGIRLSCINNGGNILTVGGLNCIVENCILLHPSAATGGRCIQVYGSNSRITNNICVGANIGIEDYAGAQSYIANNTVVKNNNGVMSYSDTTTGRYGYWYNNLVVGNARNWGPTPTSLEGAACNAGETGDTYTPWGTSDVVVATTDLMNFGSSTWAATDDYSPATTTSAQVEAGAAYYEQPIYDILGNTVPAYPGSAYNTAVTAGSFVAGLSYSIASVGTTDFTLIGASANTVGVTFKATGAGSGTGTATLNAKIDIGAYEFDLGYGAWPATFTLTIDNVVVGSSIQLEESDGTLIEFRTADSTSEVFAISASLGVIAVKIRKGSSGTKYQPYETQTTAFNGAALIYVSQVADTIAA